jgi:hypothetical protein
VVAGLAALIGLGLVLWASWPLWAGGSPYRPALLCIPGAALVALVRHRAGPVGPDIHDRTTDWVVAVLLALLAAAVTFLFGPRLGTLAPAFAAGLLAVPLWAGAVSAWSFGARRTFEHRRAFLVLGLLWPVPFSAAGRFVALGSVPFMVAGAVALTTFLCCYRLRRGTGVVLWAGSLVVLLAACAVPAAPCWWLSPLLALGAVAAGARALGLDLLGARSPARARRPGLVLGWLALVLVAAVALAGLVATQFSGASTAAREGAAASAGRCPPPAPGYALTGSVRLVPRRPTLGQFVTTRCAYRRSRGTGPHYVTVDVTAPEPRAVLDSFPFEANHRVLGSEQPLQVPVRVGRGVRGTQLVWGDPAVPLTTTVVTFDARRPHDPAGTARQFGVIVTDDPFPGAPLPKVESHVLTADLARLDQVVRISPQQAGLSALPAKNDATARRVARATVARWRAEP